MFTVTRYCVQPFGAGGKRLEPLQFRERVAALAAAKRMARRVVGVATYSVTGEPVPDLWQAPVLIDIVGEIGAACCQG